MKHLINVPTALTAAALGVIIGYQAVAQRAVQPDCPVIASVRIDKLFDNLQQRAEAKIEIARLELNIQEEQRRRGQELKILEEELEDVVAAARRAEITDDIALQHYCKIML